MAGRIRTIKPELLEDQRVAALSDRAFRLFIAAILTADDHGNLRAESRQVKGSVFWGRDEVTPEDVSGGLTELYACGLLRGYEVRDQRYAHIAGWDKHQRMDNAGKPRVPTPQEAFAATAEVAAATTGGPAAGRMGSPPDPPRTSANLREPPRTAASRAPADTRLPTSDLRPPTTTPSESPARSLADTHAGGESAGSALSPSVPLTTPTTPRPPPARSLAAAKPPPAPPRPPVSPAAAAILAELEKHPTLAEVADVETAEAASSLLTTLSVTLPDVLAGIRDLAGKLAMSREARTRDAKADAIRTFAQRARDNRERRPPGGGGGGGSGSGRAEPAPAARNVLNLVGGPPKGGGSTQASAPVLGWARGGVIQ